jgi:hypothetical protein
MSPRIHANPDESFRDWRKFAKMSGSSGIGLDVEDGPDKATVTQSPISKYGTLNITVRKE